MVNSKKSSTFAPAVPVIPLPNFVLVTNPGFCFVMEDFDILVSAFSQQRLNKYLVFNKGDKTRAVLHYKANLRLAESLYISLSVFEVALRNALSRELHIMVGREDWFDIFTAMPELQPLKVDVDKAISQIQRRKEVVTTDKIISELTFGFWVALLNSQYERVLWKTLRKAFPHVPKNLRQRKNISAPCNTLRLLRNRIFHQEAICWDLRYVSFLHQDLVKVLGWINADIASWLKTIDPFDDVCCSIRKQMGW